MNYIEEQSLYWKVRVSIGEYFTFTKIKFELFEITY